MRKSTPIVGGFLLLFAPYYGWSAKQNATHTLEKLRSELNELTEQLTTRKRRHTSARGKIRKIERLVVLQKKEIALYEDRVATLRKNMERFNLQKNNLLKKLNDQKILLRKKLISLDRWTHHTVLQSGLVLNFDAESQKSYYLAKSLQKNARLVSSLKKDADKVDNLESRIAEEKNKLDYYIHELKEKNELLLADKRIKKDFLRMSKSQRLEALRRFQELKKAERQLEKIVSTFAQEKPISEIVNFEDLKGTLPLPIEGKISSHFGRSFDSKTNLLTFQKGITIDPILKGVRQKVKAIAAGKVVFSGPLKNYGSMVIVEHPGKFYTLYGQIGKSYVQKGTRVDKGDALGHLSSAPLYFEIRQKNIAVNPVNYLSPSINKKLTMGRKRD